MENPLKSNQKKVKKKKKAKLGLKGLNQDISIATEYTKKNKG